MHRYLYMYVKTYKYKQATYVALRIAIHIAIYT